VNTPPKVQRPATRITKLACEVAATMRENDSSEQPEVQDQLHDALVSLLAAAGCCTAQEANEATSEPAEDEDSVMVIFEDDSYASVGSQGIWVYHEAENPGNCTKWG